MTAWKRSLWVLVIIAVFAFAGCATVGRDFDRTHVTDIKKGVQDKNQIREWFGTPGQVQTLTNSPIGCVERWIYSHAYSSFGGAKTKSAALVVDFDKKGKVCDHAYVEQ